MATSGNSRDVKMTLSVETLGEDNVQKLQAAVAALAKEGGDAAPEFQRLSDEIGRIGQQSAALQTFSQLSEETQALAQRQEEAATTATELRTRLDALSATTLEAAERQRAVATALDTAQSAARATRDELATLRATTDAAGKSEADYAAQVQRLALAKIEQRTEIERLSTALAASNTEVRTASAEEAKLAATYKTAESASRSATNALAANAAEVRRAAVAAESLGVSTESIAASQTELVQALNRTGRAAEDLENGIRRLADRERELAGIRAFEEQVQAASRLQRTAEYARLFEQAINDLAVAERRLQEQSNAQQWQREAEAMVDAAHAAQELARQTQVLQAVQQELAAQRAFEKQAADAAKLVQAASYVRMWREELDRAEEQARRTAEEASLTAQRINSAFSTLGVRSAQDLKDQIIQIRAAMETVRASAGATGAQIATAFAAGDSKIAELERELRGVNRQLTIADQLAGLFKNSIGQIAAGNIIADGIGYLVNKVKELGASFITTIVSTEQLRRGLMAIYKDVAVAASQFQFLRTTANAAGVAINSIQQSFVKFSAATNASGIGLQTTNDLFAAVTRAAGTLGLSGEQVTGMLEALGQMASKGTVSMEELRQQLGDRLPGALSLVAKGLGLTEAQLIKLVESGGLAARDLFPALTKALGELKGETDGLLPSYERLKNLLTESAQNAGDSGWTILLAGGLKVLTVAVGAVIIPLNAFFEILFGTAKAIGTLASAVVTLTNPMDELGRIADEAAARQGRLTQTFKDAVVGSNSAAAAIEKHVAAMQQIGTNAATAAEGLTTTAKAAEAQAFAAKLAGDNSFDLGSKLVQLKAFIDQLLSSQEKDIEAKGKLAKAAKIEGDALVQLTQLRNQDYLTMEAQVIASDKVVASLNSLATAQRTETELLVLKRDEIIKTALAQEGNLKARQLEIDEINKKIVASQAETEQTKQSAIASEQELKIRQLAIQTYKDNSAAIGEYKAAMDSANETLKAYEEQLQQNNVTEEEVAKARFNAAAATRLFNDAVADSIKVIELESRVKQANTNLTLTKIEIEARNYASLAQVARATGDFTMALYYEVEARRRQIEIIRIASEAKRLEAEATIKALEIERAALDQSDPLLKQKQAEVDIRLANAKAKLLEANAGKDAIAALEREITMLRNSEGVRESGRRGIDKDTESRYKNADSIDRQTDALENQNKTADGFKKNKDGSASGQFNNNLPVNQAFAIVDKARDGMLNAGDLQAAQAGVQQAKNAKAWLDAIPQGSVSMGAQTSATALVKETERALGRVQELIKQEQLEKEGGGSGTGGEKTDRRRNTTQTVVVNLNGKKSTINVASQEDANAVTGMLRQLESASGVSS